MQEKIHPEGVKRKNSERNARLVIRLHELYLIGVGYL